MQGIGWDLWMMLSGRLDAILSGGLARRKERKRNRKKICQGGWIGQKNETDGDLDRTHVLSGELAQDVVNFGEGIFRTRGRNR